MYDNDSCLERKEGRDLEGLHYSGGMETLLIKSPDSNVGYRVTFVHTSSDDEAHSTGGSWYDEIMQEVRHGIRHMEIPPDAVLSNTTIVNVGPVTLQRVHFVVDGSVHICSSDQMKVIEADLSGDVYIGGKTVEVEGSTLIGISVYGREGISFSNCNLCDVNIGIDHGRDVRANNCVFTGGFLGIEAWGSTCNIDIGTEQRNYGLVLIVKQGARNGSINGFEIYDPSDGSILEEGKTLVAILPSTEMNIDEVRKQLKEILERESYHEIPDVIGCPVLMISSGWTNVFVKVK